MAWYKNGQVTVQSGSRVVQGVGTAWLAQILPGEGLDVLDGRLQEIAEVISNSELLLVDAYAGADAAGVAYQIIPSASMTKELTRRVNALLATHEKMTADIGQAYTSTLENAEQIAAAAQQVNGNAQAAAESAYSASEYRRLSLADSDAAMSYRNEARAAGEAARSDAEVAEQYREGAQLALQQAEAARDLASEFAQSVNPEVLRDRAHHMGMQSIETIEGLPLELDSRVSMTAATGAALLPEGTDAQRPATGRIPVGKLVIRGSTQDSADYKLEFWNRVTGAWQALASRLWVTLKIQELLDAATGFTILYPNGGTSAAPANVAVNSRYVMSNPFPGFAVMATVELRINGVWGDPKLILGGNGSYGTGVSQNGDSIVVQTGQIAMCTSDAAQAGHGFGTLAAHVTAPVPCRVKVWKLKGVQ